MGHQLIAAGVVWPRDTCQDELLCIHSLFSRGYYFVQLWQKRGGGCKSFVQFPTVEVYKGRDSNIPIRISD